MAETFFSTRDYMLSLELIAAVKVAIQVSCDPELKREILNTPCGLVDEREDEDHEKVIWNEAIEKKTRMILKEFRLPETLLEKVISAVFVIGIRMVIWAEYHEGALEISRHLSMDFLNGSLFTQQGMIDNEKAAAELMNVKCLGIQQKYKIACIYCFTDDIPVLFKQMSTDYLEELICVNQHELVTYWSQYLKGDLDKMKGEETQDEYMLESAVEDGSKSAVEYCFKQTISKRKVFDIVFAALKAVRRRDLASLEDRSLFYNKKYKVSTWVPTDYYVDVVYFLLSKMREDEQIEFLQKDIEDRIVAHENDRRSRVIEYLLKWPYQDKFMETVNLMWDFLPEMNYAVLLLKIGDMVEPRRGCVINVNYGEEKIYDYRGLLMEFWHRSPERFKRYVFSKQKVNGKITGVKLLKKLLKVESFTNKDAKIIELVLASAMHKEKENISASIQRNTCIQLMKKEKWRVLDVLAVNLFSTKEQVGKFKRDLTVSKDAQRVYIDFVVEDRWNPVESALKWSALPEEEIDKLKKEMINSTYGRRKCENLIEFSGKYELFDKIVMWCFPSVKEIKAFKKEIVYTNRLMKKCAELVTNEALGAVDKFINCFFSSEEEIKQFRKDVAYTVGDDICQNLISSYSENSTILNQSGKRGVTYSFEGGKWEEVEKFLTWCFPSEKEINKFKREEIKVLRYIHHNLIRASQWEQAEIYFAWLGLSAEEIKDLKKDDFFNTYMKNRYFRDLFYTERKVYPFSDFGSEQEAIEILLRWYLTDKETVLEFSSEFKLKYLEKKFKNAAKVKEAVKTFDEAIAQRLSDLEEEKIGLKRKSENCSSSKRLCI